MKHLAKTFRLNGVTYPACIHNEKVTGTTTKNKKEVDCPNCLRLMSFKL